MSETAISDLTAAVHEPGTIRHVHFIRGRGEDGKFPVTVWGSIEEQIAEATLENARATSRADHRMIPLYTWSEDCGHDNPEDAERFDGVDDLLDEWMRRNAPSLTYRDGDLYWKNRARAHVSVPLYVEWRVAQAEYDKGHNGPVCLLSPMGQCCEACTDGDDDSGYEPGECRLPERIRDEYDQFWWRVSPDGIAMTASEGQGA